MSTATTAVLSGFLNREVEERLGCGPSGQNNIKFHPFFEALDWDKLTLQVNHPGIALYSEGAKFGQSVWSCVQFALTI